MAERLGDEVLDELQSVAIDAARVAGEYVMSRFDTELTIEKKEDATRSLVTEVDRESQRLLTELINERFPDHHVLGEEDAPDEEPAAPDFIWAVDPVDGTTNYANSLPCYAVSVAVLYRGIPVAAACFVPWPRTETYSIFNAKTGGGAWDGERQVSVKGPDPGPSPAHGRVTFVPGSLGAMWKLGMGLRRGGVGDPRVSGSLVHELLMVADGRAQALIGGSASIWDYAAGALIIQEAGGALMSLQPDPVNPTAEVWAQFTTFDRNYEKTKATTRGLRNWKHSMLAGAPDIVAFIAANLELKRDPFWKRSFRAVLGQARR